MMMSCCLVVQYLLLVPSSLLVLGLGSDKTSSPSRQQLIDDLLENYDPRIPPNYEEDYPVRVLVQLNINSIDSISESNMGILQTHGAVIVRPSPTGEARITIPASATPTDPTGWIPAPRDIPTGLEKDFSVGMFLRQTWNDSRLVYAAPSHIKTLELDTRLMDKLWVPDLFMLNEKKASVHVVTVPNKLMHIYPTGRIQYSLRLSATLKCNMDLRKYPLDSQYCSIIFESYGYSTDNLVFDWNPLPVIRSEDLELPQFEMGAMKTLRCDKTYVGVDYTCIRLLFGIHRSYGFYITQVYIPSVLIVILSWVSFWLDIDAVPARISLGLLTVLTMTTQSSGARASLPRVSYIKAIDVWMATCLFFVFAALLEFAYVNVLSRVEKRRRETIKHGSTEAKQLQDMSDDERAAPFPCKRSRFGLCASNRKKARNVDKFSRVSFPGSFILFNVVYWFFYIFWTPDLQRNP